MEIKDISDARTVARLNKPLLDMHVARHPLVFKPYHEESVTAYFKDCMSRPEFIHIGMYDGDKLLGFLQGEVKEKSDTVFAYPVIYVHIHQMYVLTEHRNKGIGKGLLNTMKSRVKKLGIKKMIITVWDLDDNIIDFYKAYGFQIDLTSMYMII